MKSKLYMTLALLILLFAGSCGGKSDADLQRAANDRLTADNISGVTAAVKDGVATLTGDVTDVIVKAKAEASVRSIAGIKSVSNTVNVKAPAATPPPGDPVLQAKLDEALRKVGCTGATASINEGVITLSGTVPEAKYAECMIAAQESGAGKVDNQLKKSK
jgi:hyperosmotically inducible periplasmic protein